MNLALFCHKTCKPRYPIRALVEALNEYLTKLASDAPVPGGGSAAMVVGAAACALVAMVARICAGSPKYDAARELTQRLIAQADALREKMLGDRVRDEAAFQAVVAARGNKETMQRALCEAAAVPLEGVSDALTALRLAAESIALGNANLISDLGCAAEFAYAALPLARTTCASTINSCAMRIWWKASAAAWQTTNVKPVSCWRRSAKPFLRRFKNNAPARHRYATRSKNGRMSCASTSAPTPRL